MFDHNKTAKESLAESEEKLEAKNKVRIKRLISLTLRELSVQELALVNKLIIHRKQIAKYFELQKILGRQLG